MKCPKCKGEMEEGIQTDMGYGKNVPLKWALSIKSMALGAWTTLEGERKISAFRCKQCGFLESYAK